MRFKIGPEVYTAQTLDRLTLAEILRLEAETVSLGRPMKWSQITAMGRAFDAMTPEEAEDHDDALWLIALVVWASRLRKGETLSFAEAIDFPLGDLDWLEEPEDHKPGKARAPKGSAGGGKRRAAGAANRTSETPSSPA